jgi:UDP-GlcNAc:undecaprenyl-phosphate GlcNAc-1-phosphate transferase
MSPLVIYLISFLASFLLSLIITPLIRHLAVKVNVVARPRDDRWHKRPTALLGGVSIFITLMVVWQLVCFKFGLYASIKPLLPLALGCVGIFLLGLVDDLFDTNPQHKLVQCFNKTLTY